MAAVFIVGAETLTLPPDTAAPSDANACRFQHVVDRLLFELQSLFHAGYMTALGCGSDNNLLMFFDGTGPSLVPVAGTPLTQIHPVINIPTAQAISNFAANMIIELPGGIAPSPTLLSTIASLQTAAASSNILWRQMHDIVTPGIVFTAFYSKITLAQAVVSVPGKVINYPTMPTSVQYAIDNGAPNTAAVGTDGGFHIPVARIAVGGTRSLTVNDINYPSIAATTTLQF